MKKLIRLTESDIHRLVKESVKKVLREGFGNISGQFAEIITNCDSNTAQFIAQELERDGCSDAMEGIINHMNGYGYGGPNAQGDTNW